MLSIFDTLKEMLVLWMRNFWYLAAIILFLGTPALAFLHYSEAPLLPHPPPMLLLPRLTSYFLWLLLDAARAAAILGVLNRVLIGKRVLDAACSSIRLHTWTLLRLMLLIALTFIPFGLLVSLVFKLFGVHKFLFVFALGFYLILIKYALAYPLVTVEKVTAREALARSWIMTKGHFGYVLGCYFCLWLTQWASNEVIFSPASDSNTELGLSWLLPRLFRALVESLWILLSWCMYLRIKEADADVRIPAFTN